ANTGGLLNAWDTSHTAMPAGRFLPAATSYGQYIYVTGGSNSGNHNTVFVTKVSSNGTLVSPNISGCGGAVWCTTSSFTNGRSSHETVAYNGYLYIVGGSAGTHYADVQFAKINADGSLGNFSPTSSMTQAKSQMAVVAYNGYMYSIGGCNGASGCPTILNTVERAVMNVDGTLGAWTT